MKKEEVYKIADKMDYIFYFNNTLNELRMVDITDKNMLCDNKKKTPWYFAAFGNCLITLDAKYTDKLYLFDERNFSKIRNRFMQERSNEKHIELLEKYANKTIERGDTNAV